MSETETVALPETGFITFPAREGERGTISAEQYEMLMRPLRSTRIAKRSQGGKQLSYLESWDVRAHLIRAFGFGNFDMEMVDYRHITDRHYVGNNDKEMVEAIYSCRMRLTVRDPQGRTIATYVEAAVGSTSGPANMLGEHHDNALKTAASDALKRCAINLGTQFGLGLYDGGSTAEVVRQTVVKPEGFKAPQNSTPAEAQAALERSVGAQAANTGGVQNDTNSEEPTQ